MRSSRIFSLSILKGERNIRIISIAVDVINRRIGADTVVLGSQQYIEKAEDVRSIKFVNTIRRAMKSPDYLQGWELLSWVNVRRIKKAEL